MSITQETSNCPSTPAGSPRFQLLRWGVAAVLFAGVVWAGFHLYQLEEYGPSSTWALVSGALFGYLLQRSRFCFYCGLHEWIVNRSGNGVLGLLAALAVGSLGYLVIFGAWVPYADAGFLPARAHIAPVGWHLLIGGGAFGLGMALSGSCLSAHFYRLGEGSVLSPFALLGAIGGFILGFRSWPFFHSRVVADASVIWLPASWGYFASIVVQLIVLAALALLVWLRSAPAPAAPPPERSLRGVSERWFVRRWPHWMGGIGVGVLGAAAYLRAEPLGVTAELGRLSRHIGAAWVPATLPGLDRLRGCSPMDVEVVLSDNALFVIGLVAAGFIGGLVAGQFEPTIPKPRRFILALIGGVLLGFGSMISLGCTIGTLLSGIHALAVSGWLFGAAMIGGVWVGIIMMKRIG